LAPLQRSAQRLRCWRFCCLRVAFQASIHPCFVDPRQLAHVSAQTIRTLCAAVFDTDVPITRGACCMAFLLSDGPSSSRCRWRSSVSGRMEGQPFHVLQLRHEPRYARCPPRRNSLLFSSRSRFPRLILLLPASTGQAQISGQTCETWRGPPACKSKLDRHRLLVCVPQKLNAP